MTTWLWKNVRTGKVIEHDHWSEPPPKGKWVRVYAFGLGRVEGAGGAPGRNASNAG